MASAAKPWEKTTDGGDLSAESAKRRRGDRNGEHEQYYAVAAPARRAAAAGGAGGQVSLDRWVGPTRCAGVKTQEAKTGGRAWGVKKSRFISGYV